MNACCFSVLTLAAVATPAFAALDSVEDAIRLKNVTTEQALTTRDLVVHYTLEGQAAVIRADIVTNGVSIGKQYIKTFTGDYSSAMTDVIQPGDRSFHWRARKDWPDQLTGDLQVKLCALYPEEAGRPDIYDDFARPVYANDFSSTDLTGWTKLFSRAGKGEFAAVQEGRLVIMDGSTIAASTWTQVDTPAFEGVRDWRISFDFGARCWAFSCWQTWTYWSYSISGLDEDENEVFKIVGTATAHSGAGSSSRIGGVVVPGDGSTTHLTFLRTTDGTFSVFDKDGNVGTTSAVIANPNAKIVKLRFVIPISTAAEASYGCGYIDNLKIEDISAAPF